MGVSHLFHILCQLLCDFPVMIKLTAVYRVSVLIHFHRLLHPGSQMYFIDIHRATKSAGLFPFVHPLLIFPFISGKIPYDGGRIRAQLGIAGVRIRLQHGLSGPVFNLILIKHTRLEPGNKQFINSGISQPAHLMTPSIPEVKVSHHADPHSARSPDRKMHAPHSVDGNRMGTQLFIGMVIDACLEFL